MSRMDYKALQKSYETADKSYARGVLNRLHEANLKHAWQFLLDSLDHPIGFPYICKLSQLVGGDNLIISAGFLRRVPVTIGGTTWKPDMSTPSQIKEELADICALVSPTDRSITLMLYLMRKQMFLDGNKRTSMLAANLVMISSGCGIISIAIEQQRGFTKTFVEFYESNDMQPLKEFVYDLCIDGIEFEHEPTKDQYEEEFE